MLDEVIDGLLEAVRLAHWEHCQAVITKELMRVESDASKARRDKVMALTRQMITIESIMRRIEYRAKRLPVAEADKALCAEQLKGPFQARLEELRADKRRVALGREGRADV